MTELSLSSLKSSVGGIIIAAGILVSTYEAADILGMTLGHLYSVYLFITLN